MDYQTLNSERYTNTALDDQISPYDEGWADGVSGCQADKTMRQKAEYCKGYLKGIKEYMREVAQRQREYSDPVNGFDWL